MKQQQVSVRGGAFSLLLHPNNADNVFATDKIVTPEEGRLTVDGVEAIRNK